MKLELAMIGAAIGLALWFAPEIGERIRLALPVQTSAHTCAPATEHEVLHIVVVRGDDGRFGTRCEYFGTRGAYPMAER